MSFNFDSSIASAHSLVGQSVLNVNHLIFPDYPIKNQYPTGTEIINPVYNCRIFFNYDFNKTITGITYSKPTIKTFDLLF